MAKRRNRFGVQGFGFRAKPMLLFWVLVQVQSGGSLSECMGPLERLLSTACLQKHRNADVSADGVYTDETTTTQAMTKTHCAQSTKP